jgi:anion-transporting  ArsA/GET3 family ATPase
MALARRLARPGRRVLLAETAADHDLHTAGGVPASDPVAIAEHLFGVRLDPRALVAGYFQRLLRLPFLVRRLSASATFHAVTDAAPGVNEFVVLEQLARWTATRSLGRGPEFDVVVVDGPASGHAVRLLRAPQQLAQLVPRGPLAAAIARVRAALEPRARVAVVAIADEMAVVEALETRAALATLGAVLTRPVLNRVWPKRFTAAEAALIALHGAGEPLGAAPALARAARREAEPARRQLRHAFGRAPVGLRECLAGGVGAAVQRSFGHRLAALMSDDDGG